MDPTAEYRSASPGTIAPGNTSPCEIRVQREIAESAFEVFYQQISDIWRRQEQVFETLHDVLPPMLAAMLESELIFRSRTVTLDILQRLWERADIYPFSAHSKLNDASLLLWIDLELPRALERAKELLEDYFDELLECIHDVEAARAQLFSAFDISDPEQHCDLAWIKGVKLYISASSPFRWQIPTAWFCFCRVPKLRRFFIRRYERNVSRSVAVYCNHLSELLQQAANDWLSDVKWQANEMFLERTAGWAVSAEIGRLLR